MPELPEVETVVRGLTPQLLGQKFSAVEVKTTKLRQDLPINFNAIIDQRIVNIARRAKYILVSLENDMLLVIHLGMTGVLRFNPLPLAIYPKHTHILMRVTNGGELSYTDPRRFGLVTFGDTEDIMKGKMLANLGPEPLSPEFNESYLLKVCTKRNSPIKNILMDNSVVVGIGNIYAAEALFLAEISPARPGYSINKLEAEKLIAASKQVLAQAIEAGGSSISDYRNSEGKPGYFQQQLQVYGRDKQNCLRCEGIVTKLVQAGRTSFYCNKCQL